MANHYATTVQRGEGGIIANNRFVQVEVYPNLDLDEKQANNNVNNWMNNPLFLELLQHAAAHLGVIVPLIDHPEALRELRKLHQQLAADTYAVCQKFTEAQPGESDASYLSARDV